jgi:hypothetical protein
MEFEKAMDAFAYKPAATDDTAAPGMMAAAGAAMGAAADGLMDGAASGVSRLWGGASDMARQALQPVAAKAPAPSQKMVQHALSEAAAAAAVAADGGSARVKKQQLAASVASSKIAAKLSGHLDNPQERALVLKLFQRGLRPGIPLKKPDHLAVFPQEDALTLAKVRSCACLLACVCSTCVRLLLTARVAAELPQRPTSQSRRSTQPSPFAAHARKRLDGGAAADGTRTVPGLHSCHLPLLACVLSDSLGWSA